MNLVKFGQCRRRCPLKRNDGIFQTVGLSGASLNHVSTKSIWRASSQFGAKPALFRVIRTRRIFRHSPSKYTRSRLINRSRWRGERFWPAARRDAGRPQFSKRTALVGPLNRAGLGKPIPAVGFNRGTTMQPGKRSTAHAPFPKNSIFPSREYSRSTPLRVFMRRLLANSLTPTVGTVKIPDSSVVGQFDFRVRSGPILGYNRGQER